MNVTTTSTDNLQARLTIELEPADYQPQVDEVLRDYRKKAQVPGFRPGHVPMGLIRKQYGMSVLLDEVNKLLQKKLYDHIEAQDFNILGNPLPVEQKDIDWAEQKNFAFDFDLGLKPEFELQFSQKVKVPYFKIKPDEAFIDEQVQNLRKRMGSIIALDSPTEDATLHGRFTEVDKNGEALEGGIQEDGQLLLSEVSAKKVRKNLLEAQVGAVFQLDLKKDLSKDYTPAKVLPTADAAVLEDTKGFFKLEVSEINRTELAELNAEFFQKVLGDEEVQSEAQFRERLAEQAQKEMAREGDQKFWYDLQDVLLEKKKMELPQEFLKKWLLSENKELTEATLEAEFEDYLKSFRWQHIEEQIIVKHQLEVTREDLELHVSNLMMQNAGPGFSPDPEIIKTVMGNVLQNENQIRQFSQSIMDEKIKKVAKEQLKIEEKAVTFDEFIKKVSK